MRSATCGDGSACSGTANIDSGAAEINGETSVTLQNGGAAVLTVAAGGTTRRARAGPR